jgi:eukaryotic-like serine/threonine-protein kinase
VNIIDRMVRPDYRNRYQLAREVSDDLRNFMQSQIQPSPWDNLRPHLIFGAAAAALLVGLAIPKLVPGGNESSNKSPINPVSTSKPIESATSSEPGPYSDAAPSSIASSPTSVGQTTYKNNQIQINYDPQWQKEELADPNSGEIVTFWSSQNNNSVRPNLTVTVNALPDTKTDLVKYTEESIAEIKKSLAGAKIIESKASKLAGQPAQLLRYSGKPEGLSELQNLEIWTIVNNKVYLLRYSAQPQDYEASLTSAMQSINSLKILTTP